MTKRKRILIDSSDDEMDFEEEEEEKESRRYPRRSSNKLTSSINRPLRRSLRMRRPLHHMFSEDELDFEEEEEEEKESRRYPRRSTNKMTSSKNRPLRRSRRMRRQVFTRQTDSMLMSCKINHLQRLPINSVLDTRKNQSHPNIPRRHRKLDHCSSSTGSSTSSTSSNDANGEVTHSKHSLRHRGMPKDLREEESFEKRKLKSMIKGRRELMPTNINEKELKTGSLLAMAQENVRHKANRSSCADIDPMSVDHDVGFEQIGGLSRHIQQLKEMCLFPLLYPHIFDHFNIQAPKGVLFYGPPGTGKTLVARALANECSRSSGDKNNSNDDTNIATSTRKRVAFFMRKGADCLSKWVGESERQLRLLFDQAYKMRPSIIFFDEIDGLAPVRSSRQDQIHSSIVSTLLALMDGIDSRGEVVVIGATNRLDSIDPALRRPGRFDRELRFDLPDFIARNQILQIHTRKWPTECQPSPELLDWLADQSSGYCGADLKALCTESVLIAMRERYPHVYLTEEKLLLDPKQIRVSRQHFVDALRIILPASRRDGTLISLNRSNKASFLSLIMPTIYELLTSKIPIGYQRRNDDEHAKNNLTKDQQLEHVLLGLKARFSVPASRLLLCGSGSMGQGTHFLPALLSRLDHLPIFSLNCEQLFSGGITGTPEEQIQQTCRRARLATGQGTPVVLAMPDFDILEEVLPIASWKMLISSLSSFTGYNSALLLAAVQSEYEHLSDDIKDLFRSRHAFQILSPNYSAIHKFFDAIIKQVIEHPFRFKVRDYPDPPKAKLVDPAHQPPVRRVNKAEFKELDKIYSQMLREFRIFLRDLLRQLIRDQRFKCFHLPVDKSDVPDYYDIIKQPMSLSQMMLNIDMSKYDSPESFMTDLRLIRDNAIEYNPDVEMEDLQIKHTGRWLVEMAEALFEIELNDDFKEKLEDARILLAEAAHSLKQQEDKNEQTSNNDSPRHSPINDDLELNINVEDDKSNINGDDDDEPTLLLDLDSLKAVVEKAVKKSSTGLWPVPVIESLGAEMEQIVGEFQNEWDRSTLPERLSACIDNFQI